MRRNALQQAGDRLGFLAYLTVMGGGVSWWPAPLLPGDDVEQPPPEEAGEAVRPRNPFVGTIRVDLEPELEREDVAAR